MIVESAFNGDTFILFNCMATIAILCLAMLTYFKRGKLRHLAVVLASVTVMVYVLTFSAEGVNLFDGLSVLYALALICNIYFFAKKRMDF